MLQVEITIFALATACLFDGGLQVCDHRATLWIGDQLPATDTPREVTENKKSSAVRHGLGPRILATVRTRGLGKQELQMSRSTLHWCHT